ncbi:DoxX-like family protein [Tenacibaculum jejuense]|uniref:Putative membrane protein n=1 Tax=Tenacibaculum jejuense TaxID=584609 RepID=A0A238UBU5_9FLAO|nr:DoxX-like family protein [Tenacibaculum jejuense]SNR16687.1 putative membrane protein [Tenacibaculum jejuense]
MKKNNLLKLSVFFIFIGRAWQHLFWDAPYRTFFWDESLLKPVIENVFAISWTTYATSTTTDTFVQSLIIAKGVLYVIAAISSILITRSNKKLFRIPIFVGGISLVILTILLTKEKFYHFAQFFEHGIQFGLPFVLLYTLKENYNEQKVFLSLKVLIAVTFFSHGLYAFGAYPVPGKFVDMVINIFGCSESFALSFLYIAGVLDFILAVLIFLPKFSKYALIYAVVWGLLTALARIVANFYIEFPLQSIHQNLYEVVYRLPHGLVPLLVVLHQEFYVKTVKSLKFAK